MKHLTLTTLICIFLAGCASHTLTEYLPNNAANTPTNSTGFTGSQSNTFTQLLKQSSNQLKQIVDTSKDETLRGWAQLALISKQKNLSSQQLATMLKNWQQNFPNHPGNKLLPSVAVLSQMENSSFPKKIAILLPTTGTYASSGISVKSGIDSAYNASGHQSTQTLTYYQTSTPDKISGLYQQAISEGADMVLGPLDKDNVTALMQLGSFPVPTIALNYADTINSNNPPANFYQFGLRTGDEIAQLVKNASGRGLKNALVINANNEWGQRQTTQFINQYAAAGGHIIDTLTVSPNTDLYQAIPSLLKIQSPALSNASHKQSDRMQYEKERRHDFDVIFIFTQSENASLIVPLLRLYSVTDTPIYATSSILASNASHPVSQLDLAEVSICDIPATSVESGKTNKLYAVGEDAYQLTQSLARLIQLPAFPLYGATGALTLSQEQQIQRRLPCRLIDHAG